ncbi:MAG: triose-phosphate isomerase [Patescibacteria group bacterium]|nr:triose-phosphate isomerase [Patescibacteria group bacterium]
MERFYFANWKENKTLNESLAYIDELQKFLVGCDLSKQRVVIFPPSVFLPQLYERLSSSPGIQLGAQDVSAFLDGAHTGEISARQISSFAHFALVGHSERRREEGETPTVINRKILACYQNSLTPIVCVGGESELRSLDLPDGLSSFSLAFEPPGFIGGEVAQETARILDFYRVARKILANRPFSFVYGGSVSENNVEEIFKSPEISGVLIGHLSLDAKKMAEIILA